MKILLIEDNPGDAFLIQEMLEESGRFNPEIVNVESLFQAGKKLETESFDVVLLDLGLPDSSGIGSFKKIKDFTKHLPIVVITGRQDDETGQMAMQLGADNYLIKGEISIDILSRTILHARESNNYRKEIIEKEDLLSSFMDAATDMFALFDSECKLIRVNRSLKEFFRINNYDVLEVTLKKIFTDSESRQVRENFEKLCEESVAFSISQYKLYINDSNSEPKYVSINAFKVKDGYGVVISDITDVVKYKDNLENNNKELTKAIKSKDKLFSIISHDLRSPFNAILSLLQLVHDEYDSLEDSEKLNFIKSILKSANSTNELLENLLNWSRIQGNRIKFSPKIIKLQSVVDDCVELLNRSIKNKKIEIISEIDEDSEVRADRFMLNSIFRNVISNAIKFSYEKGKITIGITKSVNKLDVFISDEGVGIPQDDIPKIFDISTGYTTIGTSNEKGSGLGMILVNEFVNKHNGNLRIESTAGEGTKVLFDLPV